MPRKIYLFEFNILIGNITFLPLVSGILQAQVQANTSVAEHYQFMPVHFHIDTLENSLDQVEEPAVAAFSVSMWNEQLSNEVARAIKAKYPNCLVIFGGVQIPHNDDDYFAANPFVDMTVRGEGEETFVAVLERYLQGRNFEQIEGISWRNDKGQIIHEPERTPISRDLDDYPSAYLSGVFEPLIKNNPQIEFQAIIETNRGCPFGCTFCNWGKGGLAAKYRFHSLDRVREEVQWIADHEIRYVFNADSNFGSHKRDQEIAQFLAQTKEKSGYPEKFRTCYGKNTDEKIYSVATLFHKYQLEKGITISPQSMNEETLDFINRSNIKLSTFSKLQSRFNEAGVPVYSEMILGLPGETLNSWKAGIESILQSGMQNQLFLYLCEIYNNTELGDPAYQKRFGIQKLRLPVTEIHGSIRESSLVTEYHEVIVGSGAMPHKDWCEAVIFNWTTMFLHGMKSGFFWMLYLHDQYGYSYQEMISQLMQRAKPGSFIHEQLSFFRDHLSHLVAGRGRGVLAPDYGEIYWEPEEVAFVHACLEAPRFYEELYELTCDMLEEAGLAVNKPVLQEVLTYQRARLPTLTAPASRSLSFNHNIPRYFERMLTPDPVALEATSMSMEIEARSFPEGLKEYVKKNVLWGRKSGTNILGVTIQTPQPVA
ncbi:B12-binding domain-containing radical SAM protein [Magnetococcus sp. PR-3]|uniref:B12-binding domain-containing radical SAM protein n=1 Tax=Magnetococcus sp. PR-3 TaxID=3120355 RepID=UPI002FCE3C0C